MLVAPFLTAETGRILVDAAPVCWLVVIAQLAAGGGGGATGAALLARTVSVVERARLVASTEANTAQQCRDGSNMGKLLPIPWEHREGETVRCTVKTHDDNSDAVFPNGECCPVSAPP